MSGSPVEFTRVHSTLRAAMSLLASAVARPVPNRRDCWSVVQCTRSQGAACKDRRHVIMHWATEFSAELATGAVGRARARRALGQAVGAEEGEPTILFTLLVNAHDPDLGQRPRRDAFRHVRGLRLWIDGHRYLHPGTASRESPDLHSLPSSGSVSRQAEDHQRPVLPASGIQDPPCRNRPGPSRSVPTAIAVARGADVHGCDNLARSVHLGDVTLGSIASAAIPVGVDASRLS